jgi:hypothetical protein
MFKTVKFILQLSALYEVKPPISKAKMTSITRGAIKAIKFYKHVVQSVEKFIQKVSEHGQKYMLYSTIFHAHRCSSSYVLLFHILRDVKVVWKHRTLGAGTVLLLV